MKKNLIPLLAVAFVVAIISTGIFYGLVAGKLKGDTATAPRAVIAAKDLAPGEVIGPKDLASAPEGTPAPNDALLAPSVAIGRQVRRPVKAGTLLVESVLTPSQAAPATGESVPVGMRAVSVHVSEIAGVVDMLVPGNRVDVQFLEYQGVPPAQRALRTVLENIEVLEVAKEGRGSGRGNHPVVTLLATPRAADILALADETGSIRLTLRNPQDQGSAPVSTMRQSALFSGKAMTQTAVARARREATKTASQSVRAAAKPEIAPAPRGIPLEVNFFEVTGEGWTSLATSLPAVGEDTLYVSAVPAGSPVSQLVRKLEASQQMRPVSDTKLHVLPGQVATALAGDSGRVGRQTSLRISFRASTSGSDPLRVMPEVRRAGEAGLRIYRLETQVAAEVGQKYLVTGIQPTADPNAATNGRKLVALITVNPGGERAALSQ